MHSLRIRNRMTTRMTGGFSAIELMVVLAIAAILFVIAYPSMRNLSRHTKLVGAERVLEGDIHQAVSTANAQRTKYQIVFNGNSYQIRQASPVNVIQTRQMPPGVTCAATDTASFFAWGLAKAVTITLTLDSPAATQTVRILANGRVSHS